jgi:hypothetical protein
LPFTFRTTRSRVSSPLASPTERTRIISGGAVRGRGGRR